MPSLITREPTRRRGVGATDPTELEALDYAARAQIAALPPDDATRFVPPWLWVADKPATRRSPPQDRIRLRAALLPVQADAGEALKRVLRPI